MCNCVEQMDQMLKEQDTNTVIDIAFGAEGVTRIQICTKKLDNKRRMRAASLFASHCPFCGRKWGTE